MKTTLKIKRIYDEPSEKDGYRILVDRLWPRGMTRDAAKINEWLKELAPSAELRKWFGHEPARWPDFQKRYRAELKKNQAATDFMETYRKHKTITLLYGAKDPEHNQALVLQEYLSQSAAG